MVVDIVQQLGYLTLGTRLKRIGERLQADTQRIFEAQSLMIPSGQWPFLAALDRLGPLTVGDLAKAVGVTQPGATRTVAQLVEEDIAKVVSSDDDLRLKTVSLTPHGKRLVATGKEVAWPLIECAVRDLCGELKGPLLAQLAGLEEGLERMPLHRRAIVNPEVER
jgi:DNA-binding MarR family transcriptional regulator